MNRIRLCYDSLRQVSGSGELWILVLTDEQRRQSLSVVCDEDIAAQMRLRINAPDISKILLPEALVEMLPSEYEMLIVGVYNGQYQVVLMDVMTGKSTRIRISDAVLLSIISSIPLYIEEELMKRQNAPCDNLNGGVSIPINAMNTEILKVALEKAVEDENYELASHLRDEINLRKNQKDL